MKLPAETLRRKFEDPIFGTMDSLVALAACPHCKRVQTYTYRASRDAALSVWGPAVVEPLAAHTRCVAVLKCEEPSCEIPMPLFGQWSFATTEQDWKDDIATWVWDGLVCPAGHSIRKPAD
jgi:hypothetical protein